MAVFLHTLRWPQHCDLEDGIHTIKQCREVFNLHAPITFFHQANAVFFWYIYICIYIYVSCSYSYSVYLGESVHVPNIEFILIRCVPRRHASLNLKASQPPDRSPEGLKDLASRLLDAKMECLRSTIDCIPALKQVSQLGYPPGN